MMKQAMRALCAGLLFGATIQQAGHAAIAAVKRPVAHEDVWLMKRPGAPAPSPDGRWIVFQVTEPSYEQAGKAADLWLVPTGGGAQPRRLTDTAESEGDVVWSPDSTRIAFATRRHGSAGQIYVLDLARGGEARRVTELASGARDPAFSPDGTRLLYISDVVRGAKTPEDIVRLEDAWRARKYNARVYESFPVRNWDRWLEDRTPRLFAQVLDDGYGRPGPATDLIGRSALAASPGFAGRYTAEHEELDAIWSPDGRHVVFVASSNRHEAAYSFTDEQLYRVPATGGDPELLTQGRDSYSKPAFAPDGRTLYALREARTPRVYNASRLVAMSWPRVGEPRNLTASLDRAVESFVVAAGGRDLYFLAEDAGLNKLYTVPSRGGEPREAVANTAGAYTSLASAQRAAEPVLVANWESATSPPEVVRIDVPDGHTALTRLNADRVAQLDLPPVQHFWFDSARGQRIHNMLVLPPGFDPARKYPLFALIHGGPHSMWRDQFFLRWNYHLLAAPGYVVLLTNYKGSTGFGEAFAQSIQGDPLAGPGADVNDAADEAIRRFTFIDGERQCAGGASYGGHLANWLQATTTRYKCLVSHAGLVNLESQWATSDVIYSREVNMGGPVWEQSEVWREQNPIRRASQFQTPVLVTVGERDYRVPLNNTLEYWSALQRQRVPSKLIVFPEENHWILDGENSRFFYGEMHRWLARWLGS